MMNERDKQLISSYVDGECTVQECERVESLILGDREYQAYYQELMKLSTVMEEWEDADVSPDLDRKLRASLAEQQQKGLMMKKEYRKYITGIGAGTLLIAVIVGVFTFHQYGKRGIQGRFTVASDDIGEQFRSGDAGLKVAVEKGLVAATSKTEQRQDVQLAKVELDSVGDGRDSTNTGRDRNVVIDEEKKSMPPEGVTQAVSGEVDKLALLNNNATRFKADASVNVPATQFVLKDSMQVSSAPSNGAIGGFQRSSYEPSMMPFEEREIAPPGVVFPNSGQTQDGNTEEYNLIKENAFLEVVQNAVSTFSIDVDTGSYSNVRRYLNAGQLPPVDAVRLEEMINYFSYAYPQPENGKAFSITLDAAGCPWNEAHQLVRVGIKGKSLEAETLPPSNLVFLIDVSGSMNNANKLPLLKKSLAMMLDQMTERERIAIVVYAGAAGKVLDSTPASSKMEILNAINNLNAGGSTAGGAGIQLAYEIARQNFIKDGNNRVILATDGDFNVGVSSTSEMTRLIEEKRKDGIFLTVLGFGTGNTKDGRMEQIANTGNGNYYYIDTLNEAKKVLVSELGSTLFTIAKDVKIQVEFNPGKVKAYRLLGYENRMLAKEDFNNDAKDAGELGAGHTVTALYEIVPADSEEEFATVDKLKYQQTEVIPSPEMLTVKIRYKNPDADVSQLVSRTLEPTQVTENPLGDFQWATAVAEFGMVLRQSEFKGTGSYDHVLGEAQASLGKDAFGYRAEFIDMVKQAKQLDVRPANPGQIQFK